jgi:formate-dependent nitrite reductase membrane component NrfD
MTNTLVITYLFLGGAGAGALFVLIMVMLLMPSARRPVYQRLFQSGFQIATGALMLSALCLAFDLGRPDRLLLLFLRPTLSYLTLGTYALSLSIFCALVLAIVWSAGPRLPRWAERGVEGLGLTASFAMMLYTGLLFQSIGDGILLGSVLLPVLFVLSSLSTGVALLFAAVIFTGTEHDPPAVLIRLLRADSLLICVETVVLAVLLSLALAEPMPSLSVLALARGSYALPFWLGVVGLGLLGPLFVEGATWLRYGPRRGSRHMPQHMPQHGPQHGSQRRPRHRQQRRAPLALFAPAPPLSSTIVPCACMVLVGGYCLRLCLLGAGLPSYANGLLAIGV